CTGMTLRINSMYFNHRTGWEDSAEVGNGLTRSCGRSIGVVSITSGLVIDVVKPRCRGRPRIRSWRGHLVNPESRRRDDDGGLPGGMSSSTHKRNRNEEH